eukprot:Opistho-2@78886
MQDTLDTTMLTGRIASSQKPCDADLWIIHMHLGLGLDVKKSFSVQPCLQNSDYSAPLRVDKALSQVSPLLTHVHSDSVDECGAPFIVHVSSAANNDYYAHYPQAFWPFCYSTLPIFVSDAAESQDPLQHVPSAVDDCSRTDCAVGVHVGGDQEQHSSLSCSEEPSWCDWSDIDMETIDYDADGLFLGNSLGMSAFTDPPPFHDDDTQSTGTYSYHSSLLASQDQTGEETFHAHDRLEFIHPPAIWSTGTASVGGAATCYAHACVQPRATATCHAEQTATTASVGDGCQHDLTEPVHMQTQGDTAGSLRSAFETTNDGCADASEIYYRAPPRDETTGTGPCVAATPQPMGHGETVERDHNHNACHSTISFGAVSSTAVLQVASAWLGQHGRGVVKCNSLRTTASTYLKAAAHTARQFALIPHTDICSPAENPSPTDNGLKGTTSYGNELPHMRGAFISSAASCANSLTSRPARHDKVTAVLQVAVGGVCSPKQRRKLRGVATITPRGASPAVHGVRSRACVAKRRPSSCSAQSEVTWPTLDSRSVFGHPSASLTLASPADSCLESAKMDNSTGVDTLASIADDCRSASSQSVQTLSCSETGVSNCTVSPADDARRSSPPTTHSSPDSLHGQASSAAASPATVHVSQHSVGSVDASAVAMLIAGASAAGVGGAPRGCNGGLYGYYADDRFAKKVSHREAVVSFLSRSSLN